MKIAVLMGADIGYEVVPECTKVLTEAASSEKKGMKSMEILRLILLFRSYKIPTDGSWDQLDTVLTRETIRRG